MNIINQVSYLKASREFPANIDQIANILNRAYPEIANAINERTIGFYPTTKSAITGNQYYLFQNKKQQSLRQTYVFTGTTNIKHGINATEVSYIGAMYGQYSDSSGNWYGIIAGTSTAIAGQILFYLTPTDIVFNVDAGAPVLSKGIIVIEWISQP